MNTNEIDSRLPKLITKLYYVSLSIHNCEDLTKTPDKLKDLRMRFSNEDGFCELNPFPGCKWLVVSNYAYVYKSKRGKGNGKRNHDLRVERAKKLGYNFIVCTVRGDNVPEKHILVKSEWKQLTVFVNHDGDTVEIWGKQL